MAKHGMGEGKMPMKGKMMMSQEEMEKMAREYMPKGMSGMPKMEASKKGASSQKKKMPMDMKKRKI